MTAGLPHGGKGPNVLRGLPTQQAGMNHSCMTVKRQRSQVFHGRASITRSSVDYCDLYAFKLGKGRRMVGLSHVSHLHEALVSQGFSRNKRQGQPLPFDIIR